MWDDSQLPPLGLRPADGYQHDEVAEGIPPGYSLHRGEDETGETWGSGEVCGTWRKGRDPAPPGDVLLLNAQTPKVICEGAPWGSTVRSIVREHHPELEPWADQRPGASDHRSPWSWRVSVCVTWRPRLLSTRSRLC